MKCSFQNTKNSFCGLTGRKVIWDLKNANFEVLIKKLRILDIFILQELVDKDKYFGWYLQKIWRPCHAWFLFYHLPYKISPLCVSLTAFFSVNYAQKSIKNEQKHSSYAFFLPWPISSFHLFLCHLLGLDCYNVGLSRMRGTPAA